MDVETVDSVNNFSISNIYSKRDKFAQFSASEERVVAVYQIPVVASRLYQESYHGSCMLQSVALTNSIEIVLYPRIDDPGIDDCFNATPSAIMKDRTGLQLYMSKCKEYGVIPIRRVVESLHSDILDLNFYYPTKMELRSILDAMSDNQYIQTMNFSGVTFDEFTAKQLCHLLESNNFIKSLNFSKCFMGPEIFKNLTPALKYTHCIRDLDLSHNNLGLEGLECVAEFVMENYSILILNLSHNQLDESCMDLLKTMFLDNATIQDLDLSWNRLDGNFKPIMFAIAHFSEVKRLNLAWNGLSTENFCEALELALKRNTTLRSLDLSHNQICGYENVRKICSALREAEILNSLSLAFNPLSANDAFELITAFSHNSNVFDILDLSNVWLERTCNGLISRIKRAANKTLIYSGIIENWKISNPSMTEILLKRAQYLSTKSKKRKTNAKKNFLYFLCKLHPKEMSNVDFTQKLKDHKIKLDRDLVDALLNAFAVPHKNKTVNVEDMLKEILKIFPEMPCPIPEPKKRSKKKKSPGRPKSRSKKI